MRDYFDHYQRRAKQGRELAAQGSFTPNVIGSITDYSAGQSRRMLLGERSFLGLEAFARLLGEPIRVGAVGKVDKGPCFVSLTGSSSGKRIVLDLPELLEPDALEVRNLRFARWPREDGN